MSVSSRTMSATANNANEESDVTPRINKSMFSTFVNRRVRVAEQLLKVRRVNCEGKYSNYGNKPYHGCVGQAARDHPGSSGQQNDRQQCRSMEMGKCYEILGRVISEESMVLERFINLGDAGKCK
ncbi:hypothetical protein C8R47DRAFT_1074393 [Mycena vitilis]|nr:hypothetical protein C8R47DRAFT_1074393 [Mycena vitilis]